MFKMKSLLVTSLLLLVFLTDVNDARRPFFRKTSAEKKQNNNEYMYKTMWYNQTLDHFTFNNDIKFRQRFLVNDSYWSSKGSGPIFFYTGNEGTIEAFAQNSGFMWDIAPRFDAMLVFAEHRYYGESLPFGPASTKNVSEMGYLTSEQALADYAELVTYIRETMTGAERSAVIAFGGSYGGMLSAWFRKKYPHICQGAIAASAPVAQFVSPCDAFGRIVTADFSAAAPNGTCSTAIRKSWGALDRLASQKDDAGLKWLNENWKLCDKFTHKDNVTHLKAYLNDLWTNLAMMDYPYPTSFLAPLPANPVNAACQQISGIYKKDEELLLQIFKAASVYFNTTKTAKCLNITEEDDIGADMWNYQACSEMVMPFCYDGVNDMFEAAKWDLDGFLKECQKDWGLTPRPFMADLMYGSRNLDGASNIVFSNGLLDPWSSGGVLKSMVESVTTILIPEGAHHLDLRSANPADPKSVVKAREKEIEAIKDWVQNYRSQKAYPPINGDDWSYNRV